MEMVLVTDETGSPLSGVNLTVYFSATGNPVDCSPYHDGANGRYCILNDHYVDQLDEDGKEVTAIFEKSGYQTRTLFYLFCTDPCRCHIHLVKGPLTIILGAESGLGF